MSKLLFALMISAIGLCAATSEIERSLREKLFDREYEYVILETDKLLAKDSSNASILELQATALYHKGQTARAVNAFEKAYKLDSRSDGIAHQYAKVLLEIGYTEKAREVYQNLFLIDSTDISVLRPYAKIIYESGEYVTASNLYKIIVTRFPQDISGQRMLAKCFVNMGESNLASKHFAKALHLAPESSTILYDYARHEYSLSHLDKVIDLINKADWKALSSTKFLLLRGDTYFKMKEYTLAIPFYNKLWLSGFRAEDVSKRMGYAYFRIAAYPRALELFQEAVELGDTDAATFYYIAKCFESQKQYDEAIESYKASMERLQPNYLTDLYQSIGSIYSSKEDIPNAIAFYKKALELEPDSALLSYFLADAYDSYYEDKSPALEYYKKAATESITPILDKYIQDRIKTISESLFLKQ